jgi:hypothetical protein
MPNDSTSAPKRKSCSEKQTSDPSAPSSCTRPPAAAAVDRSLWFRTNAATAPRDCTRARPAIVGYSTMVRAAVDRSSGTVCEDCSLPAVFQSCARMRSAVRRRSRALSDWIATG